MFYFAFDPELMAYQINQVHLSQSQDVQESESYALEWCIAAVYTFIFLVAVVM